MASTWFDNRERLEQYTANLFDTGKILAESHIKREEVLRLKNLYRIYEDIDDESLFIGFRRFAAEYILSKRVSEEYQQTEAETPPSTAPTRIGTCKSLLLRSMDLLSVSP